MSTIKGNSLQNLSGVSISVADLADLKNTAIVDGDVGAANGVAPLGPDGKIPVSVMPSGSLLTNFNEGVNATFAPSVPVVYFTPKNSATDVDVAISPKGAGSLAAQVADGTITNGNKRGSYAVDWQMIRTSATKIASGNYSIVAGGQSNIASGQYATVSGGISNSVNGNYGVVSGGFYNTCDTIYSVVSGGYQNGVSGSTGTVAGGFGNTVTSTGSYSFIGSGISNTVTSSRAAVVAGGESNRASSDYSSITGGYAATTRKLSGAETRANGVFNSFGDAQRTRVMLKALITTNSTTTVLTSDLGLISSSNVFILPSNSCFSFSSTMVYRDKISGECASWLVTGLVKMGATASTISLVGTPSITLIAKTGGVTTTTVGVGVNTTLGALTFTGTSETSGTVNAKIIADVQTVELVE